MPVWMGVNFQPELWPDGYFRPHYDSLEQFFHVIVFQRHAAPGPIAARAVPMNINVAAEPSILWRRGFLFYSLHDCIVLRA